MANILDEKLRKFFRKKRKENCSLAFKGDGLKIFDKLPLNAYKEFAEMLTNDEFYDFQGMFKTVGKQEVLFSLIPSNHWFDRCTRDLRLFDSLSDEYLERILSESSYSISNLFFAEIHGPNCQHRIMCLLHEQDMEGWIKGLSTEQFSELNDFLVWLYEKERDEDFVSESEKATVVFQKFANLSGKTIATLLENTNVYVTKRILRELRGAERDLFSIYQEVQKDKLYEIIVKSDYELLNNASIKVYSWVYRNFDREEKEDFSRYLADEKRFELQLFNAEICVGIYDVLNEGESVEFIKKIFKKKGLEGFKSFYEILSTDEKERMFELLLENKGGKEVVENFLNAKKEEEMNFFERIIKEHYF